LAAHEFPAPFAIQYRDVLRWFDNDEKKAEIYNPHFTPVARRGKLPIPKNSLISVPISKKDIVRDELVDEKTYRKISQNSLRPN
jgi:membrane-bound lytic murein transglycosylase D